MNSLRINHLAVLVCVIVLHALGFVWFGAVFGEKWMKMVGIDQAQVEADPPGGEVWVMNLIASVAGVYALAWLLTKLGVTSGVRGAAIGFIMSLCFHHLQVMNNNMFAQAPYGLAWITGGFSLLAMAISGFILGAWTKRTV